MQLILCAAMFLLAGGSPNASAGTLTLETGLTGELSWVRVYTGIEEYYEIGGPIGVTVELPNSIQTIHSLSVAIVGDWVEGCSYDESYDDELCHIPFFNLVGSCIDIRVRPQQPGLAVFQWDSSGCDLNSLIGAELSLVASTDMVSDSPFNPWGAYPSVLLHLVQIQLEVDSIIATQATSWSRVKALFDLH